jgi:hypothetical protein
MAVKRGNWVQNGKVVTRPSDDPLEVQRPATDADIPYIPFTKTQNRGGYSSSTPREEVEAERNRALSAYQDRFASQQSFALDTYNPPARVPGSSTVVPYFHGQDPLPFNGFQNGSGPDVTRIPNDRPYGPHPFINMGGNALKKARTAAEDAAINAAISDPRAAVWAAQRNSALGEFTQRFHASSNYQGVAGMDAPIETQVMMGTTLGNMNVGSPFGNRNFSIAEIQAKSPVASPALQNYAAELVSGAYSQYFNKHGKGAMEDFYGTDPNNISFSQATNRMAAGNMNVHPAFGVLGNSIANPGTNQTFRDMYPGAFRATSIGQLSSWLQTTVTGGVASGSVLSEFSTGRSANETTSDYAMGIAAATPFYNPSLAKKGGYAAYAVTMGQAFNRSGVRFDMSQGVTNSLDAMPETLEAPGGSVEFGPNTYMQIQARMLKASGQLNHVDASYDAQGNAVRRHYEVFAGSTITENARPFTNVRQGDPLYNAGIRNGDISFGFQGLTDAEKSGYADYIGSGGEYQMLYGRMKNGNYTVFKSGVIQHPVEEQSAPVEEAPAMDWLQRAAAKFNNPSTRGFNPSMVATGLYAAPTEGATFEANGQTFSRPYVYGENGASPVPLSGRRFGNFTAQVMMTSQDVLSFRDEMNVEGGPAPDRRQVLMRRAINRINNRTFGTAPVDNSGASAIDQFDNSRLPLERGEDGAYSLPDQPGVGDQRALNVIQGSGAELPEEEVAVYADTPSGLMVNKNNPVSAAVSNFRKGPIYKAAQSAANRFQAAQIDQNRRILKGQAPIPRQTVQQTQAQAAPAGVSSSNWSLGGSSSIYGSWLSDKAQSNRWMTAVPISVDREKWSKVIAERQTAGKAGTPLGISNEQGVIMPDDEPRVDVLAHELGHQFADTILNPQARKELYAHVDALANTRMKFTHDGVEYKSIKDVYEKNADKTGYTPDQIKREVTADIVADVLGQGVKDKARGAAMEAARGTTPYKKLKNEIHTLMKNAQPVRQGTATEALMSDPAEDPFYAPMSADPGSGGLPPNEPPEGPPDMWDDSNIPQDPDGPASDPFDGAPSAYGTAGSTPSPRAAGKNKTDEAPKKMNVLGTNPAKQNGIEGATGLREKKLWRVGTPTTLGSQIMQRRGNTSSAVAQSRHAMLNTPRIKGALEGSVINAASTVTPETAAYYFETRSSHELYPSIDDQGNTNIVSNDVRGEMKERVSSSQLQRGASIASEGFAKAVGSPLPADQTSAISSIQKRVYQHIMDSVSKVVSDEMKSGTSEIEAKRIGETIKQVATGIQGLIEGQAFAGSAAERQLAKSGGRKGINVGHNVESAQNALDSVPGLQARAGDMTPEQLTNGPATVLMGDDGTPYTFGGGREWARGGGGRSGGGGGRGGIFRGGAGAVLYGAYMLGREWKMAMGNMTQEADAYSNYLSQVGGPMLPGGIMAGSTDIGANNRQRMMQDYYGRTANQVTGGFNDVGLMMTQGGDSFGRMASYAKYAQGIAGGGVIASGMANMMLPEMFVTSTTEALAASGTATTLAGVAGPVALAAGLTAGAGLLNAGISLEAYNRFTGSEVTPGSIARDASRGVSGADYLMKYTKMNMPQIKGRGGFGGWDTLKRQMGVVGNSINMGLQMLSGNTPDEITNLMTPLDKALNQYQGTPAEVNKALKEDEAISLYSNEDKDSVGAARSMLKRVTGSSSFDTLKAASIAGMRFGLSGTQEIQQASSVAEGFGMLPGDYGMEDFIKKFGGMNVTDRAKTEYTSQRTSALGSQLQSLMSSSGDWAGFGARVVNSGNLTSGQTGVLSSMAQGIQSYSGEMSQGQWYQASRLATANNSYVGSQISGMMSAGGMAGLSNSGIISFGGMMSDAGMSNQQAFMADRIFGGDMKAMSFQAWQNGTYANRFYDQSGNNIWQTNGAMATKMVQAWTGNSKFQNLSFMRPGQTDAQMTSQLLGTSNQQIIDTYNSGGFQGMQRAARNASYDAQMASAGIQLKGIQLQEQYLWGSGSWNSPASGSSWGIEDRQRVMQYASQRADFNAQQQSMEFNNSMGIAREQNSWQRMQTTQSYNDWQLTSNYTQAKKQQQWAQEDYQYQDTQRNQSFGWQMEDITENLKYATGRDRKNLLKQRDRAAVSFNEEGEQIDTQRQRQKETWALEDERFQKQKQYQSTLNDLDTQSFELNKTQREKTYEMDKSQYERKVKEFEQEKSLQEESTALQRKYQMDQLQLQKESAGASAAAAAIQREWNESMTTGSENLEKVVGQMGQLNSYDKTFAFINAVQQMAETFNTVSTTKVNDIIRLINAAAQNKTASVNPYLPALPGE